MNCIYNFDFKILNYISENLHTDFLDKFFTLITQIGGHKGLFWIGFAIILIIIPKTRKIGIAALIAMLIGFIVTNLIIKNAVARIRPYDVNTAVELLVKPLKDYSFPSGHTCVSFAASSAVFLFNKKLGIPALILAVFIGFSRLYLYVHYPTDVLAGAVIGIVSGIVAVKIVKSRAVQKKLFKKIE